ncbi:hypothetical protein GH714_002273 [Hevea brasiliensis]|uniref:F-box associated domain-containing protein n=1 Tax=Hevea brasiliensis TaxID=3981 RepID=A0A6A6L1D2_HEVBR|nr:hypothetical protein GH714_002273 [Hevea brasiliensis]
MQMRFQDLVLFDRRPFFHSPTSQENAARNSGLLFFSYSTRELVWPFKENVRYLLYPDESFPANPVEELDCPFKGIKRFVNIVGSCNGVFCLSDDVYGKYAEKAFLWNPSVRKIVNIPCPNFTFTHMDPIYPHLGLALIPLLMIISFLSWVATKRGNGPGVRDVIVSFSLGEEVFGEMEEKAFTVWMMKEYGIPGSWTKLFDISHLKWIRKLVAFRQSVEASEDNSTNEILEDVASSSNSQLVIDEANGEPKEEAQGESISTQ